MFDDFSKDEINFIEDALQVLIDDGLEKIDRFTKEPLRSSADQKTLKILVAMNIAKVQAYCKLSRLIVLADDDEVNKVLVLPLVDKSLKRLEDLKSHYSIDETEDSTFKSDSD